MSAQKQINDGYFESRSITCISDHITAGAGYLYVNQVGGLSRFRRLNLLDGWLGHGYHW